jgi:hypothetical protein
MQFLMFEQNVDDIVHDADTEQIYRYIYKSISSCISNILIDEQNINNSMPPSPRRRLSRSTSRRAITRRGSWSIHN